MGNDGKTTVQCCRWCDLTRVCTYTCICVHLNEALCRAVFQEGERHRWWACVYKYIPACRNATHGNSTGLYQQQHSHLDPGKPWLPGTRHFSEPLETPQAVLGTPSTWQALIKQSGFSGGLLRCSEGHSCVKRGCGRWGGPDWRRKGFGELTADLLDLHRGLCTEAHSRTSDTNCNGAGVTWPREKVLSGEDNRALEQGHRDWQTFVFGGLKTWMNKVLVWPWCRSHFEQQVGLDTSWGPFHSELFHNVNLDPRENHNVLLQFSTPGYTFQIFTKMQPLSRGDKTHAVWFISSQEHRMFPPRICNNLEYQIRNSKRFERCRSHQLPECSTSGTQCLNIQSFFGRRWCLLWGSVNPENVTHPQQLFLKVATVYFLKSSHSAPTLKEQPLYSDAVRSHSKKLHCSLCIFRVHSSTPGKRSFA